MEREVQPVDTRPEEAMDQSFPGLGSGEASPTTISEVADIQPVKVALACAAAAVFPGLGHLMIGRWGRAFLLSCSVLSLFALGLFWMDGHLYQPDTSEPLSIFPFLANAGLGGIYALCYLMKTGFVANAAAPGYELGNTFLFGAGLLNYLIILDAFDIAMWRKH
jgi:hypothetical protein